MEIALGSNLYLKLQLTDGNNAQYVKAFIKDEFGNDLSSQILTPQGDGVYGESTQLMPNKPKITCSFIVYSDSGYSNPAPYSIGFEEFYLQTGGSSSTPQSCVLTASLINPNVLTANILE